MILNVSGRTDIVAFYMDWFIKRLEDGYVDVRNPFYPKQVNRIIINKETIDAIIFCTKNPLPLLKYIDKINYPFIVHITLTPYHKDIEPNVLDKKRIITAIKKISSIIGKERVIIRYDPIFFSEKYNLNYHKKAFKKVCEELKNYTSRIIVSFLDLKKNTLKNRRYLNMVALTKENMDSLLAYQYDFVCNGNEMASGAVRNHSVPCLEKAFELVGYTKDVVEKRFSSLYNAFQYGAPPHAGMAPGIDRIIMLLRDEPNLREVQAFPMSVSGMDAMMGCPSEVSEQQLREIHIKIR